jgi:membrane-anchored mycosin MYCP
VAAPGTGVVSLAAGQPGLTSALVDARGEARALDGTSFATPYVAGLAALVRDRYRNLTARQVMHRIQQTAQHTAGPGGRSEDLGYGMIDPVAALTAILAEEQPGQAQPSLPTRLEGLKPPPPPQDTFPRTVALVGSAAALGLLGLTMVIIQTLKRNQRRTG